MQDFKNRIRPDWVASLKQVLDRARAVGPSAVLAFDLDSTLFDNLPRQARIVREFGAARGITALTHCAPRHWTSGWDMRAAMINCGLPESEADRLYPEARAFWQARFFTSPYCLSDEAIEGAAAFVQAAVSLPSIVAYVTGRHEGMREGTLEAMRQSHLPLPGGPVHLIMKPTLEASDDAFKREAHAQLARLGTVVAAFDNEPTHANDYRRQFPEATVIHLATDHSGRAVELLEGVISVPYFSV